MRLIEPTQDWRAGLFSEQRVNDNIMNVQAGENKSNCPQDYVIITARPYFNSRVSMMIYDSLEHQIIAGWYSSLFQTGGYF